MKTVLRISDGLDRVRTDRPPRRSRLGASRKTAFDSAREHLSESTVAMLMAGGRGDRLRPLTSVRAKPAVPFGADSRIIDFTLSNCVDSGIRRVHVLTQYLSASLEAHIAREWEAEANDRGCTIDVSPAERRGHNRAYRGTADALYQNIDVIAREQPRWVLVLGGDHLYRMDYRAMIAAHVATGAEMTIAAVEVPLAESRRMGVMTVDRRWQIHGFDEKPAVPTAIPTKPARALASMGVYVFDTEVLRRELALDAARAGTHDFGQDIIPGMVAGGSRVFAFPFRDPATGEPSYWRDIGTLDSYYAASMDLLAADPLPSPGQPWYGAAGMTAAGSLVATGASDAGSRVVHAIVGPGCSLEMHSIVEQSVLFRNVTIGRGARIRRAILDEDVWVAPGASVGVHLDRDRERFTVTEAGVVVVPKGMTVLP